MQAPTGTDRRASTTLARLAALGALALALGSQAGPLADPTRPPATAGAAASAVAGSVARASLAAASAPAAAAPPLLQSVQLPVRGPAVALVDGHLVKAGDLVGKLVVLSIDSQGLVLAGDKGNQRLWLISGNGKQAPGSITTTRAASFVPAPLGPDPGPENAAAGRTDRAGAATSGTVGTLSLAGRTPP